VSPKCWCPSTRLHDGNVEDSNLNNLCCKSPETYKRNIGAGCFFRELFSLYEVHNGDRYLIKLPTAILSLSETLTDGRNQQFECLAFKFYFILSLNILIIKTSPFVWASFTCIL
jgi:hypothetical protein